MSRLVASVAILVAAGWAFVATKTYLDADAPTGFKVALIVGCIAFAGYVTLSLREE